MGNATTAIGGIAGPVLFVAAWVLAGLLEPGYSPVEGAVSRLAAEGASTRPVMTAGLAGLALGMLLFAAALRASLAGPAWTAAFATGLLTLGVAAVPLGRTPATDDLHAAFAVAAYAALVATPLLAARPLAAGRPRFARLSLAVAVASGVCLAASALGAGAGLFQRLGLTLTHAWIVMTAAWLLRDRAAPPAPGPARRAGGRAPPRDPRTWGSRGRR